MSTRGQALSLIAKNVWKTLSQDTQMLKLNMAMIVSYGMVTARSFVSTANARRAAKTESPEDAAYAKREAYKTIFREWVGATSNYGVIKVIDTGLKWVMRKVAGAEKTRSHTVGPVAGLKQAASVLIDASKASTIKATPDAMLNTTLTQFKPGQMRLQGLWEWVGKKTLDNDTVATLTKKGGQHLAEAGFEEAYKWGPICSGAILGCYLSGWLLERASLLHGEKIVDYLSGISKLKLDNQVQKATDLEAPTLGESSNIPPQPVLNLQSTSSIAPSFPVASAMPLTASKPPLPTMPQPLKQVAPAPLSTGPMGL